MITFLNMDCMEYMKTCSDKQFDLAICDPEYGINAGNMTMGTGKNRLYKKHDWDKKVASSEYFNELRRISKNQIIWGGNYFSDKLPVSRGWICWDKVLNKDVSFADGELAWTSFDCTLKIFKIQYSGFLGQETKRIHPTEKPIKLYRRCLKEFANEGETILDTHGGSMSSAIAAHQLGFDMTVCEIDLDYFESAKKRFDLVTSQTQLAL